MKGFEELAEPANPCRVSLISRHKAEKRKIAAFVQKNTAQVRHLTELIAG